MLLQVTRISTGAGCFGFSKDLCRVIELIVGLRVHLWFATALGLALIASNSAIGSVTTLLPRCIIFAIPRPLSGLFWKLLLVVPVKFFHVPFEGAFLYAATDAGKELGYDVVVVDLQEHPPKHLFGMQKVLKERSVVLLAGVAFAMLSQRREINCVLAIPAIDS